LNSPANRQRQLGESCPPRKLRGPLPGQPHPFVAIGVPHPRQVAHQGCRQAWSRHRMIPCRVVPLSSSSTGDDTGASEVRSPDVDAYAIGGQWSHMQPVERGDIVHDRGGFVLEADPCPILI
jgi:hypothetical protein